MKKQTYILVAVALCGIAVSAATITMDQTIFSDFRKLHPQESATSVEAVIGSHVHHSEIPSPGKNWEAHEGERIFLGSMEFPGCTIEATRVGDIDGTVATFEFAISGDDVPRHFRAWIGEEFMPEDRQALVRTDDLSVGGHTHLIDANPAIPFLQVAVFDKESMRDIVRTVALYPK